MSQKISQHIAKVRHAFKACESYMRAYEAAGDQPVKLINVLHEAEDAIDQAVSILVDVHRLHPDLKTLRYR